MHIFELHKTKENKYLYKPLAQKKQQKQQINKLKRKGTKTAIPNYFRNLFFFSKLTSDKPLRDCDAKGNLAFFY